MSDIHPDMRALLKAMGAKWLKCAPENGFWWHQPAGGKTAVIGWLDLARQTGLPAAVDEVFSFSPEIRQIVTFAPENSISKQDQGGLAIHIGEEFICARKPLKNESSDFHGIRFYNQLKEVEGVDYTINVGDDFIVRLKEESYFSALNGTRFIVAYEEAGAVRGASFVHGVTANRCWIRRLFVQPGFRGKGISQHIDRASFFLAEQRLFKEASILAAKRIWEQRGLGPLGFVPEKTVRHMTITR